jgi:hypothetical protein
VSASERLTIQSPNETSPPPAPTLRREDERETRRLARAASARHLAIVHAMDLDQA